MIVKGLDMFRLRILRGVHTKLSLASFSGSYLEGEKKKIKSSALSFRA